MLEPDWDGRGRPPLVRYLGRVLGVAAAGAMAAALILVGGSHTAQLEGIVRRLLIAFVYSCCIAFPSALILRRLGHVAARRRGATVAIRVAVLLATNVIGCLVAGLLLVWVGIEPREGYWRELAFAVAIGASITLTFGLSMSALESARLRMKQATLELRTRQMEEERGRKLIAEARLSSLESRIHPHFLFNTLNSIASLIPKDPRRAEDTVGKLASLLRFSLNASRESLVPLGQELKVVRDYLEIERVRFGDRLRSAVDVPAELEEVPVPPLSVETLVENSVKHVIASRPDGGEIRVSARTDGACVELDVADTGPGFALETIPLGHGLDNVSGRLALLFGEKARLSTHRDGAYAVVRLSLPRSGPAPV